MKKLFLTLLYLPLLLCADIREEYAETFGGKFSSNDLEECFDILNDWERTLPEDYWTVQGLKACVLLGKGEIEESTEMMDNALCHMEGDFISSKTANIIRDYYDKAWNFDITEEISPVSLNQDIKIELCTGRQPKGVKIRYWLGIAQIVAGCVAAPFSAGTSLTLITSGVAMTVSAASDAIDNKAEWEDNLNRRQRMGSENTSYKPSTPLKLIPYREIVRL